MVLMIQLKMMMIRVDGLKESKKQKKDLKGQHNKMEKKMIKAFLGLLWEVKKE